MKERRFGFRPARLIGLAALIVLAGVAAGLFLRLFPRAAPWRDDWTPPPGFSDMITDLSAGRADDGQRRMDALFRRYRSAVWRRRAGLALGIARLRRREFPAAEKALEQAERAGGPAEAFASLKRAEAMAGAGRPREASELLSRARTTLRDPALADDLAIALARSTAAAGAPDQGIQTLSAHVATPSCRDRSRVMEAQASIALAAGRTADAASVFRRIYLEFPRSPEAGPALERLRGLVAGAPLFRPEHLPSVSRRARAQIAAGDGKGALATWDLALGSVPSAAADPRWRNDIAEAAIEARQAPRALLLLGTAPARRGDAHRSLLLGRALFASGRDEQAIQALRASSESTGEDAGSALFLLATGLDQKDRDREALQSFLKYITLYPRGGHIEAATWRAGWLSYRRGQRDGARRLFQSLLDLPGSSAYRPSALYWLARVEEADRKEAAVVNYRTLVHDYTRDYYGLLAARRVESLGAHVSSADRRAARPLAGSRPGGRPARPFARTGRIVPPRMIEARAGSRPAPPMLVPLRVAGSPSGRVAAPTAATGAPAASDAHASPAASDAHAASASPGAPTTSPSPGAPTTSAAPGAPAASASPGASGAPGSPPAPAAAAAAGELGRPARAFCEQARKGSADERVLTGCELEMIYLYQDAEREYESAAAEAPNPPLLMHLSEIAMRRGDRAAALARLKAALPDYLAAPIASLPHRYWEVLFPRSDWDAIVRYSREQSLDPSLVAGLILQESAFNPLAVSQAGALGLMQVLPGTGADAARALGIPNFSAARLLEPEINIRIGCWHLAGILGRFGRRPELALAAYNAGESRVRHWQSVFGTSEPTYFVEEVPYLETRLYVKRVLSHSAMYRAIYGS